MRRLLVALLLIITLVVMGCGGEDKATESVSLGGEELTVEKNSASNEKLTFKEECEKNTAKYPAKVGSILYTKGDHYFTGTKYYFNGEIIKLDLIENDIGDPGVWLVKNENGYVMPIQYYYFEANIGDKVEVWGTLSGNGYANAADIDNVVGQTGSMHAMQVSVNGEEQY